MLRSRFPSIGLVVALVLAVSGCQSTGGHETPIEDDAPPPAVATAEAISAEPEIPERIDLESLIRIALARNESVIQARQGIAIAQAEVKTVYGQTFLPRIVASVDITSHSPTPTISTPGGDLPTQPSTTTQASLGLQFPLFHPAEAFYGYPAAMLGTDLATYSRARTEQQIRALVTNQFFRRIGIERRGQVIREFIRSLESQVKDTRVRVDAGAAIENDVLKIELELTRQKQDLVENENAGEIAAMRLNTLLALPRQATYELIWEQPFAVASLAPADTLVQRALEARPDLKAESVGIRQLELLRKREKAGFYPSLDAFTSWTHTNPTSQSNPDSGTLGVSLNWDLFDGNVRNSRAARIGHEIEQARSRLREARRDVALEIEDALRVLENQASAVHLGGIAVNQANENFRVQRELYRNQRSTANDLLEAEVQLTNAKDTVVQATYTYEIALGVLEAAVGVDRAGLGGE